MRIRNHSEQRSGFVLVMTLFLIAIMGMLLASLARYSMSFATDAIIQKRDLQKKWGLASCQKFALQNAKQLLSPEEKTPLAKSTAMVNLSGYKYEIVLADESAKLDVNFLLSNSSRANAKQTIRELAKTELPIRLRPLDQKYQDVRNSPIECWGQVFGTESDNNDVASFVFRATENITCWSRRLNYEVADKQVLLKAITLVAGGAVASRIMRRMRKDDEISMSQIISETTTNENQRKRLSLLITNRSQSQSVWIRTTGHGRHSTSLTVSEGFTNSIRRIYTFSW